MTSVASAPLSMTLQKSSWHSPVPYLFGDLAAMLGLIAFALLILACSYVKLSGYLEIGEGSAERDLEAGAGNSSGVLKPAPVFGRLRETKVLGRLAQNREAARKSRLREKAYVQQLETSRLKLLQLEQELERTRQQGAYISGGLDATHLGYSGAINSGIAVFVLEYGNWVEEQNRQICELRTAMNSHLADVELRILVHSGMNHYFDLFRMKATAAKADVFYLMSGIWKTSAEQFFLWIGGFRPSELLKVLLPHLDLLEQQVFDVYNLRQSCQQAEDALSQGMDKLQQTLSNAVAPGQLGGGSYISQIANAMEKLEALVSIVDQADHIRQETLQQMSRILTTRQAARGLLALGEYFQRLRALSSLWATRQPA